MALLVVVLVAAALMWLVVVTDPDRVAEPEKPDEPDRDPIGDHRCEAEALLVNQRLAGLLKPADYQRAMAQLAVNDADRRPVRIPPDRIG